MITQEKFLDMKNRYHKFHTLYFCLIKENEELITWTLSRYVTLISPRKYILDSSYENEFFTITDDRLQKLYKRLKDDLL